MRLSRFTPILMLLVLVVLPACDFVGDEETLQLQKNVNFRFEFSTDGSVGETMTVNAEETVNIDDVLFDEGYTRDEIATANIRSVSVERIQPVGTDLDVFDRIDFSLVASGVNVPTHATSSNLPSDDAASLSVSAPGVSEVLWRGVFGAEMSVVPTIEEDFILDATVSLRIDVEGI